MAIPKEFYFDAESDTLKYTPEYLQWTAERFSIPVEEVADFLKDRRKGTKEVLKQIDDQLKRQLLAGHPESEHAAVLNKFAALEERWYWN